MAMQVHCSSYLGLSMSSVHSFPHSLSQVHFSLTSLRLPIPQKEAEAGVFREAVSDVQVELVLAYVEEDAWLRMGGVDQEVTGCSPVQSVACFPHFMVAAEFYSPMKTHLWSASIYKQTAIT